MNTTNEYDSLLGEIADLKDEVIYLEDELASLEDKNSELRRYERDSYEWEERAEQLEDELAEAEDENHDLQRRLADMEDVRWLTDLTTDGTFILYANGIECPKHIMIELKDYFTGGQQ